MQPEGLDAARKDRVSFGPVKYVEAAVEAVLILAKIQIQGVEYLTHSNISVECGDEEPCPQVIAWNV